MSSAALPIYCTSVIDMKKTPPLMLICILGMLLVAPALADGSCTNDRPDQSETPPVFKLTPALANTAASVDPQIMWQTCLGGNCDDRAYSITGTMDGGYAIAGLTNSKNGDVSGCHFYYDFWVVKLNSVGELEWQKCLGGMFVDEAYSIIQTADGGYVVAGVTASTDGDVTGKHGSFESSDVWVVRLDSTGNIEWQKCLGGSSSEGAMKIKQTTDGGYAVAGYTSSQDGDVSGNHGKNDYWVVKLSDTGAIEWQKCLGGSGNDYAQCIIQTADGGFAVAGYTNSQDGDVSGIHSYETDCWIVKLNENGAIDWQKCLGGRNYDEAYSIIQTADGGYTVAGFAGSTFGDVSGHIGGKDFWVVRLDATGTIEWQKCMGGICDDVAQTIIPTPDGGCVVAGRTYSCGRDVSGNHGKEDYWVVRLDPAGEILWEKCLGGCEDDSGQDIIPCFDGSYVMAGWTASIEGDVSGNHGENDYWVVRFSLDGLPQPPLSQPAPTARFDINRNTIVRTENTTFTAGTYHTNLTYRLHAANTDPTATLGNLTFVAAADGITWVDEKQYATWNATHSEWTFPPEYTIHAGCGRDVRVGTAYAGENIYNHTITRITNVSYFRTDGVQHTTVSVTFDDLDFESVFVGFATANNTNVTTEIIPESVVTNAPLAEPLPSGGAYHLKLDTAGLVTGSEYFFSFDTRISLNGTPAVHIPLVYVWEGMSHDSAVIGETYRAEVPAGMLPADADEFSVETNTSCEWTVVRQNNLLSILDGSATAVTTPLPVANFTAAPQYGPAPLCVTCTDASENACEWVWDFGDNVTSSEQNPVHTYDEVGIYSITLTVSNQAGTDTLTRTDAITVPDVPTHPPETSERLYLQDNGTTVSDGEGGQQVRFSPGESDGGVVSGDSIVLQNDGINVTITTGGLAHAGGVYTGNVTGVILESDPLTTALGGGVGNATFSFTAAMPGYNPDAEFGVSVYDHPSDHASTAFRLCATQNGLHVESTAYAVYITKTNLTEEDAISGAVLQFTAGEAWVMAHGGRDTIRVMREADCGTCELLETTCTGTDGEGNFIFEAQSPNGFSAFAVAAVSAIPSPASVSSGGGGTKSGSTAVSAAETIITGVPVSFEMQEGPARTAEITFTRDLSSVLLTVHTGTTLPTGVNEQPAAEIYRYLTYTLYRASPNDVASARVGIAVPLTAIEDRDVLLLQYVDGEWTPLSMEKIGEENGNAIFSAETSSLSTFAIAFGDPVAGSPADAPEKENISVDAGTGAEKEIAGDMNEKSENRAPPTPTTSPGFGWVIAAFSLAAAGRLLHRQ